MSRNGHYIGLGVVVVVVGLGGLQVTGSLMSGLYPSLTQVNTFSGCIRNVLSNGYYLDM
ncbi:unnamed protein product, partial [Rotaria sordida]